MEDVFKWMKDTVMEAVDKVRGKKEDSDERDPPRDKKPKPPSWR